MFWPCLGWVGSIHFLPHPVCSAVACLPAFQEISAKCLLLIPAITEEWDGIVAAVSVLSGACILEDTILFFLQQLTCLLCANPPPLLPLCSVVFQKVLTKYLFLAGRQTNTAHMFQEE